MFLERDGVVNTSVASFRSALESLGLGEITLREVAEKVNQILVEAIDSADALLQAIDDAHAARIIADNDVSELRALIHNTISEAPSDSHASIDLTVADPDYADTPLLTESDPVDIRPDGPVKLEVGAVLRGRFQLEAVLGGGGMGKVYRGVDLIKKEARDRNPYVAVKVLNEKFSVRADAFIALQREASRQQRLAHPNIAIVYDFDRAGSVMYMTMELLEGRPLDMYFKEDVIPRGGLPLDEAMGLIEGMAAALGYAHKQGMIHGDFKPGNCFVSDEGHLKVLDFGIARVIQTPGQSDTLDTLFDGSHLGAMTPAYASPEMLEGSAGADPRDDIYGLACVVYQLLGGVHPMAQLPADKAKALAYEPKPIEHLTRRQNDALRRGLAFERESRIASAEEFVESLRDDRPKHAFNQKHLTVAMALVVLIAASFAVPKFLEDRRFGEISEKVASREPPQVVDALENIGNQPIERRGRFLSVLGPEIIDFYREHFDRTMQMPDKALPFESLEIMFDAAIPLFPDSATLLGMREQLVERKHDYIAALSSQFESMVADEIVRSREEVDGLNLVLEQLRRIEPDSVLLDDERLTTSLANGAKTALIDGDLTAAKNLLAQAQRVATNDTILRDIADQIERAAQEQKRLARVEDLAALLVNSIGGLLALTDLASLQSTFSELEQLAPEHEILESIGHQLRERFPDSIKTIDAIPSLPALAPWSKILGVLALLGLEDVADAVQTRKTVLTTRSEVLAQRIRDMIHAPSANDKRVQELKGALAELAAIGSEVDADLRLPLEAVDAYRERARELQQDNEWDAARTHLQAARAFAVALRAADLEKDLAGVDAAEVRAGELARLKSEQAAKAEKDALIEATTRELNALLSNLTINGENLGNARHLIETLNELLDRDATIVPEANRTITQTVVRGVERAITARQFDSAEDTLNTARNHGFFTDELAELEQTIEQGRRVAKAIAQTEALESAIRSIDTLLAESTRLTQRERQRQIAGAFKALTTLGSDDSTLTKTQQRVAAAYLSLADELANQDRFTLARQLLDEANAYDAGKAEIDALRARIDAAETNYKTKRAEAELADRRSAVRSQFENFLKVGEPGMAERFQAEGIGIKMCSPDRCTQVVMTHQKIDGLARRIQGIVFETQ